MCLRLSFALREMKPAAAQHVDFILAKCVKAHERFREGDPLLY